MIQRKRMGRFRFWLCRRILLLNWIPRYGRYYTVDAAKLASPDETDPETWRQQWTDSLTKHWSFQRYGQWGINILDQLDWLWDFADEEESRALEKGRDP